MYMYVWYVVEDCTCTCTWPNSCPGFVPSFFGTVHLIFHVHVCRVQCLWTNVLCPRLRQMAACSPKLFPSCDHNCGITQKNVTDMVYGWLGGCHRYIVKVLWASLPFADVETVGLLHLIPVSFPVQLEIFNGQHNTVCVCVCLCPFLCSLWYYSSVLMCVCVHIGR